jgi:WD40 repeat protein
LKVWDLEKGSKLFKVSRGQRSLRGHSGPVAGVAVTRDGKRAVSASADETLKVWDLESGRALRTLEDRSIWVKCVAVTGDGKRVVAASGNGNWTLKVWDLESGRPLRTLEGHSHKVLGVAVTGDGRRVVSASSDTTLRVWDLESSSTIATFQRDASAGDCACAPPNLILAGDRLGRVYFLALEE